MQLRWILALAMIFSIACSKTKKAEDTKPITNLVVESESQLPECTAETLSQMFWIQDQSKFVMCDGANFVEIKGTVGETGEKGGTGDTGATGATGSAGTPANSGVWIFDKNNKVIALLVDSSKSIALFSNGGLMALNFFTGTHSSPVALDQTGGSFDIGAAATCIHAASDCSDTCYQLNDAGSGILLAPVKGSVFKSGSSYYTVTGSETKATGLNLNYYYNKTTKVCDSLGSPITEGWAITTLYSFPEGISLPLQVPLSFGTKTE